MPLVRAEVRSEYGLGKTELYKEVNKEEPKAVLDGVAVAGLVGILRQLGDLAEFAAEVFHGLQEGVMTTSSRSHKLMARVKKIEAVLPSLEETVLSQTSHIHFAYTAGSEWHPCIRIEKSHFTYQDLPRFVMDAYEECRHPPRLHLLDRFNTGGPGSCIKRYSDPTFFKRSTATIEGANSEKVQRDRKAIKTKRKRSLPQKGEEMHDSSISDFHSRLRFASVGNELTSYGTASKVDVTRKSDSDLNSFDSRTELGQINCVFDFGASIREREQEYWESPSLKLMQHNDLLESAFPDEQSEIIDDKFHQVSVKDQIATSSSCVMWDERSEIVQSNCHQSFEDEALRMFQPESLYTHRSGNMCLGNDGHIYDKEEIVDSKYEQSDEDEAANTSLAKSDTDAQRSGSIGFETDVQIGEKTEIMECEQRNESEGPKLLLGKMDLDQQEDRTISLSFDNQKGHLSDNGRNPESASGTNQIEEIESEPDNYMDALNTIETESENDLDCQTKQRLERGSSCTNYETADQLIELERNANHLLPKLNSLSASTIPSDETVISCQPDVVPSESVAHELMLEDDMKFSKSDSSLGADFYGCTTNLGGAKLVDTEPFPADCKIDCLHNPSEDKTISHFHVSEESSVHFSSGHPVKFWTNGGLLGLQPSKPPDFSSSRARGEDILSEKVKDERVSPSSHASILKDNVHEIKQDSFAADDSGTYSSTRRCTFQYENEEPETSGSRTKEFQSVQKFSPADINIKHEDFSSYGKFLSVPASQENDENSVGIFGLGQRLLLDGFRKKLTLNSCEKSEAVCSEETSDLVRSGHQDIMYLKMSEVYPQPQFGTDFPISSLPPSPPLEHMRISFHPVNESEASNLKLKFPDGRQSNERITDVFPLFQLVPRQENLGDIGSDSDENTFCRSSPYASDDGLSIHSDLNSEQWECGETLESRDHESFNASSQISATDSISISVEPEESLSNGIFMNSQTKCADTGSGVEVSLPAASLDLPSLYALYFLQHKSNDDSNPMSFTGLQHSEELTPPLPPLPPAQWRVLKTHLTGLEDQKGSSEILERGFQPKILLSTASQQSNGASAKREQANESSATKTKDGWQDRQKLGAAEEDNLPTEGNGGGGDFLRQIRAKSISLRRTQVTEKATAPAGPAKNGKVAVILQKANAIRQAVGSDDGDDGDDDDGWSDR